MIAALTDVLRSFVAVATAVSKEIVRSLRGT